MKNEERMEKRNPPNFGNIDMCLFSDYVFDGNATTCTAQKHWFVLWGSRSWGMNLIYAMYMYSEEKKRYATNKCITINGMYKCFSLFCHDT